LLPLYASEGNAFNENFLAEKEDNYYRSHEQGRSGHQQVGLYVVKPLESI
jgi:hypothetical protein